MNRVILSAVTASLLMAGTLPVRAQTKPATRPDDGLPVAAETAGSRPARDPASVEAQYARRAADLAADDVRGHYDLARWCGERKRYRRAREHLLAVLRLNSEHAEARLMLQRVEAHLADPAASRPATEPGTLAGTTIPRDHLVSDEDILRIRLAELRSKDRVAITFRDRADYRFVEAMHGSGRFADRHYEQAFMAATPVAKAIEMLNTPQATDLRDDILVRTNPRFMTTFKTRIWPMLAESCASAECHGSAHGKGARRLRLYNARSQADELYFTNFLLLDAFESSRGRMIDRAHPARSLLLKFSLPADDARAAHPVPIEPMFGSTDDRRYELIDEWIRMLVHPHPQYALDDPLPGRSDRPRLAAEPPASDADEAPASAPDAAPETARP